MKILICDDNEKDLSELKFYIEKYMDGKLVHYEIDTATASKEVLQKDNSYDLAFLDIEVDETNGIVLAKELRKRNSKTVVFFVTAFTGYIDAAMDLHAFRFFEKPFDVDRLFSGLDKAMEYIDETYVDIFLYDNQSQIRVLTDNIIYLRSEHRRIVIVTTQGEFVTRTAFSHWLEVLPQSFFYQVHKSFFVNLHYVEQYKYTELYLMNTERIPIAPRKQSAFYKYWFEYMRRR